MANSSNGKSPKEVPRFPLVRRSGCPPLRQGSHTVVGFEGKDQLRLHSRLIVKNIEAQAHCLITKA